MLDLNLFVHACKPLFGFGNHFRRRHFDRLHQLQARLRLYGRLTDQCGVDRVQMIQARPYISRTAWNKCAHFTTQANRMVAVEKAIHRQCTATAKAVAPKLLNKLGRQSQAKVVKTISRLTMIQIGKACDLLMEVTAGLKSSPPGSAQCCIASACDTGWRG